MYASSDVNIVKITLSSVCREDGGKKDFKALIKRERKSSEVLACVSFDRQLAMTCGGHKTQVDASLSSPQEHWNQRKSVNSI